MGEIGSDRIDSNCLFCEMTGYNQKNKPIAVFLFCELTGTRQSQFFVLELN